MDINIDLDNLKIEEMDDKVNLNDCIPMNKTNNDVFFSKLYAKVNPTPDNPPHEEPYLHMHGNEAIFDEETTFNEDIH